MRFLENGVDECGYKGVGNMPSFTQAAIKQSFLKLLEQYPISKITVKMIVLDCGVNRNTFYYHFEDIPMLLEAVIVDQIDVVAGRLPDECSLAEGVIILLSYLVENKKKVAHIWNSSSREFYEMQMMKACKYIIQRYFSTTDMEGTRKEKKELYTSFLKYELFGLIVDWLSQGMAFDIVERGNQIGELLNDILEASGW